MNVMQKDYRDRNLPMFFRTNIINNQLQITFKVIVQLSLLLVIEDLNTDMYWVEQGSLFTNFRKDIIP